MVYSGIFLKKLAWDPHRDVFKFLNAGTLGGGGGGEVDS